MRNLFLIVFISLTLHLLADDNPLWLRYPSISPDGKTIVFEYQGDLFTIPVEGGTARHLTVHEAYDFMPVWSPDSKYIAFASTRFGNFDIYLIPAEGGQANRLTFHSSNEFPNSFTPDGKSILFSASIRDARDNVQFPSGVLSELYSVPLTGGKITQVLSTPAEMAVYDASMSHLFYHDRKGYENAWRKHHTSAIARDIWMYDVNADKHTRLTTFVGEDRNPVYFEKENKLYYLSEQFGDFNVCRMTLDKPRSVTQMTDYVNHPVRFLSISNEGTLCYSWKGELYIIPMGEDIIKVPVTIANDEKENQLEYTVLKDGATEMELSPTGKEIVFITRGEVFVTSTDFATTKRITNTPEQERSVSFSPDGRAILYASERDGSWNLYQTKLLRKDEAQFSLSTALKEDTILATDAEEFQPHFSPDGKEVAYLEERETLRVFNLDTKAVRTILDGKYNYSYSDGDQWYEWSPDGKWIVASFSPNTMFINDVALIDANGGSDPINLTLSGYNDAHPRWMLKGNAIIWYSDREGMRSHGSWGAQDDVYAYFLNEQAWDRFKLIKEEYELVKEQEKNEKEKEKKANDGEENDEKEKVEDIKIDLKNLEDRKAKLTINSSNLADAILTPDGEKLYYLSKFEDGYDLWVNKLKDKETKMVMNLKGNGGALQMDKKGENLYLFSDKKIIKIKLKDKPEKKAVTYKAELNLDKASERAYMFEHVWRQVEKKFYTPDLQGVDWQYYKQEYSKFLPYINNNFDFAEMLSEMLGELNASHTGSGYRFKDEHGDATASLGAFYDPDFAGPGIKVIEIIEKGPLINAGSKIKNGVIIEKIDMVPITADMNYFELLNHKDGKNTLLSLYDPTSAERWEETVKPINRRQENELLYQRWVKKMRSMTDSLSGGRLGYVHVKGMNSSSFREFYSEALGRNWDKEALIVDTRFNGGGWLHDDLATMLNGKKYVDFYPRGVHFGHEPMNKWVKPSIVLISESNYSDAHGFPFAYKALDIGDCVGMPVPGTMTAVWWETLQDNTLYFGIPQVGTKDKNGDYLENKQLEPDYKVRQDYDVVVKGRDQQLEKAVEVLLDKLDNE
ncbi:MAG: peptidase S41 [Bacteroidetes bacterium]|nr:peptidase S41 [Bacteroidota bacterium]